MIDVIEIKVIVCVWTGRAAQLGPVGDEEFAVCHGLLVWLMVAVVRRVRF